MANARPTPNRRRRETSPDEEARIEAFAQQAATLLPVPEAAPVPVDPPAPVPVAPPAPVPVALPAQIQTAAPVEKEPKNKSYTFRMTKETLDKLRSAAAAEDRSIQWVFDKILLPALDK
ncbi:hypothetical protein [Arthrobacter sp. U41]|uniref:hypothetical protein n=1 Tax=Arthrobacter sp. U41 TaxID=1849032 RepID=UPI0012F9DE42|nr:hypothetical protein [Arthrobacter sp. U41]